MAAAGGSRPSPLVRRSRAMKGYGRAEVIDGSMEARPSAYTRATPRMTTMVNPVSQPRAAARAGSVGSIVIAGRVVIWPPRIGVQKFDYGMERPGLDHRTRSLITIALLAAGGRHEELNLHIRATRNTGATPDEVKEVLLQVAVYAGVPAANSAFRIAKTAFEEIADKDAR